MNARNFCRKFSYPSETMEATEARERLADELLHCFQEAAASDEVLLKSVEPDAADKVFKKWFEIASKYYDREPASPNCKDDMPKVDQEAERIKHVHKARQWDALLRAWRIARTGPSERLRTSTGLEPILGTVENLTVPACESNRSLPELWGGETGRQAWILHFVRLIFRHTPDRSVSLPVAVAQIGGGQGMILKLSATAWPTGGGMAIFDPADPDPIARGLTGFDAAWEAAKHLAPDGGKSLTRPDVCWRLERTNVNDDLRHGLEGGSASAAAFRVFLSLLGGPRADPGLLISAEIKAENGRFRLGPIEPATLGAKVKALLAHLKTAIGSDGFTHSFPIDTLAVAKENAEAAVRLIGPKGPVRVVALSGIGEPGG